MHAAYKRTALVVVGATSLAVAGVLVGSVMLDDPHPHIEPLFAEETTIPLWPPEAPVAMELHLEELAGPGPDFEAETPSDSSIDPAVTDTDLPGLRVRTGTAEGLHYIEAVLGAGASFDDELPMAVLIHGRGDRARVPGGPFWGLGSPIRVIVPQAPDPLGDGFEWLPVRVGENLIDRLTTSLIARAGQLAALLRGLMRRLPTTGRVLVVGFSQGGLLTFALATHHTDVVQAAFPLSAWLPPALVPRYRREDLTYPPIRGMHGTSDEVINPEPTERVYQQLSARGFDVQLELFDGVGHEMTAAMNEGLHGWLREAMSALVPEPEPSPCVEAGGWPWTPDGGWPEAGPPEAGWPGWYRPEAGWPEGGWAEVLRPEAGWPDGAVPAWAPCPEATDGGVPDGGVPDGSVQDAGTAPP